MRLLLLLLVSIFPLLLASHKKHIKRPLVGRIGEATLVNWHIPLGSPFRKTIRSSTPDTTFLSLAFSRFDLPPGDAVVLTSQSSSFTYTANGPLGGYSDHCHGSTLTIEYIPQSNTRKHHKGLVISHIITGLPSSSKREDVCGVTPQWQPTICIAKDHPQEYANSKSVARLTIQGTVYGTGFLLGCDGYFLTNYHNIMNSQIAASTQFEFGAESPTCKDPCNNIAMGCKGSEVIAGATLIASSKVLDYSLLQFSQADQSKVAVFGYLSARQGKPKLDEEIYVPHHPEGFPKAITSMLENGTATTIVALNVKNECGTGQVGYFADTKGGSSGAPILAKSDHKVIGLHHCGGCENVAHSIHRILNDLRRQGFHPPQCFYQATTTNRSGCSLVQVNVDFIGFDIASALAPSVDHCCSLCKAQRNCKAYSWSDYQGGTCWLKSEKGNSAVAPGVSSGVVLEFST